MRALHILVVEDEEKLARLIARALTEERHVVEVAHDGETGLDLASSGSFDLVVLDIMLPRKDGFQVCRELRRQGVRTPILMLTARDAVTDRVQGLDAGADDYLVKPFALEELLARVRALGRRPPLPEAPELLRVGDLELDLARREVRRGGEPVELTAKEFALLEFLMRNAGLVLSRDRILENVWGFESDATPGSVDIYVHFLRRKLDRPGERSLIKSVRGVGYKIEG